RGRPARRAEAAASAGRARGARSTLRPAPAPRATIHRGRRGRGRPAVARLRRASATRTRSLAAAEAPLAAGVFGQGRPEVVHGEVRPRLVDEDELRVGELPEEEVRDPAVAPGPDQQVRVRKLGLVPRTGPRVLVDLVRSPA